MIWLLPTSFVVDMLDVVSVERIRLFHRTLALLMRRFFAVVTVGSPAFTSHKLVV